MTRLDHQGSTMLDNPPARLPRGMSAAAVLLALAVMVSRPAQGRAEDLISGIGLSLLTVYDQRPAPGGLMSGSPHVHAVTDEGYYVVSGLGRVELHDLKDGFRSVELSPGRYIQFPPGVVHRLVNTDHLVLLVVMGNAGLAERGDARIYFGKAVDDNPTEFARLVGLAKAKGLEGALDRRDAAIRAYVGLLESWAKDRTAYFRELERFIGVHMKAAAGLRKGFSEAVEAGPVAWGERFRRRLENLPLGREELSPVLQLAPDETTLGMCGVLRPVTKLEAVGPGKSPEPIK
jgi:mannose-6-phosphate isomerase-like protein (cupin superfamily)